MVVTVRIVAWVIYPRLFLLTSSTLNPTGLVVGGRSAAHHCISNFYGKVRLYKKSVTIILINIDIFLYLYRQKASLYGRLKPSIDIR